MRNIPHIRVLSKERSSTKKKLLCVLWLALSMLLSSCNGAIGSVPDTTDTNNEPSVTISTPIPVKESAPIAEPQETTVLIEPDPIVEETAVESTEPNIDNVPNEHISVFAGVYAIYDQPPFNNYGYPPKITIDETGRVSGQMLSGKTPIYVTENDNGTLICMISEGEEKFDEVFGLMSIEPREFYVICPVGVTSGFEDYPDYDELAGIDSVRIRYIVLDGGAIDVMYHKIG